MISKEQIAQNGWTYREDLSEVSEGISPVYSFTNDKNYYLNLLSNGKIHVFYFAGKCFFNRLVHDAIDEFKIQKDIFFGTIETEEDFSRLMNQLEIN